MNYKNYWKRVLDFSLALIGLIVFIPIITIAYTLVKFSSPGPGFFIQQRLGYQGQVFKVFKIRTMHVNPNRDLRQTNALDPEIFFIGKILRRTKLDELPQIINVLLGDMSLIGPRPGLPSMLDKMPEWAKMRLSVRPGVTGLAQVNGNVELTWEERWKYDIHYLSDITFLGDIKILFRTVMVVLFGEVRFRRLP